MFVFFHLALRSDRAYEKPPQYMMLPLPCFTVSISVDEQRWVFARPFFFFLGQTFVWLHLSASHLSMLYSVSGSCKCVSQFGVLKDCYYFWGVFLAQKCVCMCKWDTADREQRNYRSENAHYQPFYYFTPSTYLIHISLLLSELFCFLLNTHTLFF